MQAHDAIPGKSGLDAKASNLAKDPIWGTIVDKATALTAERGGRTYYFCSPACKRTSEDPERELKSMRTRVTIALSGVLALANLRAGAFLALAAGATIVTRAPSHHLPPNLKSSGLSEINRVLKPGGRLLVIEPDRPDSWLHSILFWPTRFHPYLKDHLEGRTADIIRIGGFTSIMLLARWAHWIAFWGAQKPQTQVLTGGDDSNDVSL